MSIKKENIELLFDTMKYYDEQYNEIADNCFLEIYRALNEICEDYLRPYDITVLPVGSYAIKNNYQVIEPIEFYCVLPANRDILIKEKELKKHKNKKKNSVKDIYAGIFEKDTKNITSIEVAKTIMQEMQKYLAEDDKVYFKNNVVFIKINMQDEDNSTIFAQIHVVYQFENDSGILEFPKLGHKFKENTVNALQNIQQKNVNTNGNYLLFCKLIKMLELELILNNQTNKYLSQKTLFVENVLYNVPDKFYQTEDFCEMFRNVANYLKHVNMQDILLADNTETQMFKNGGYYANEHFKSFVKKITYLYENTDNLINDAINNQSQENQEKDTTMQNTDMQKSDENNDQQNDNIDKKPRNKINKNLKQ